MSRETDQIDQGATDDERPLILVVDDSPPSRAIYKQFLQHEYRLIEAGSGEEALALLLSEESPQLILLDLGLPGIDGFTVLRTLQQLPSTRRIPVIIVTMSDDLESEERGFTLGAVDYVTKPVQPSVLRARVGSHLALAESRHQLELANRELELRVAERTRHLERALRGAEAADRAKSQFLYAVGHEVRTPMNAILAISDLLLDDAVGEEWREQLVMMREGARSLMAILGDILDFAAAESDGFVLQSNGFKVCDEVRRMERLYAYPMKQQGITFSLECTSECDQWLIGDSAQLRTILHKLLDNAVKFTRRGQIVVSIAPAAEQPPTGLRLRFSISDSGCGIAADKLEEVVEPFVQAEEPMHRSYRGLGLGLAIARQRVELLGGSLSISSRDGEGTTVAFESTFARSLSDCG